MTSPEFAFPRRRRPLRHRHVDDVRADYAAVFGKEALNVQRAELRRRFPCCGERRTDGHHPSCSKRPGGAPSLF